MTFAKAQKIILKIKTTKNNNASLTLRLEGAAQFGGGTNFNQNPIPTSSTSSPTNIPTSGTPVGNTPNANTGQTPNVTYNPNTGQTPAPTYNQNTAQTPTPTDNTGQTGNTNTGNQALSSETSHKVIVVLKNGQVIEGTYNGSSIFNNEIGKKITLTVRGKDLPKFNPDDVRSITIEQ